MIEPINLLENSEKHSNGNMNMFHDFPNQLVVAETTSKWQKSGYMSIVARSVKNGSKVRIDPDSFAHTDYNKDGVLELEKGLEFYYKREKGVGIVSFDVDQDDDTTKEKVKEIDFSKVSKVDIADFDDATMAQYLEWKKNNA